MLGLTNNGFVIEAVHVVPIPQPLHLRCRDGHGSTIRKYALPHRRRGHARGGGGGIAVRVGGGGRCCGREGGAGTGFEPLVTSVQHLYG